MHRSQGNKGSIHTVAVVAGTLLLLAVVVGISVRRDVEPPTPMARLAEDPSEPAAAGFSSITEAIGWMHAQVSRAMDSRGRAEVSGAARWVEEHRPPSWPYRRYETTCLARFERALANRPMTVSEMLRASVEEMRALLDIDADGDGAVSDGELLRFAALCSELDVESHPYLRSLIDADQDGEVSAEERMAASQLRINEGVFGGIADRISVHSWDFDGDGRLTPEERELGAERLVGSVYITESGQVRYAAEGEAQTREEQAEVLDQIRAAKGDYFADVLGEQIRDLQRQSHAAAFLEASFLVPIESLSHRTERGLPPEPTLEEFSADGSGVLTSEEAARFREAVELWREVQADSRAVQTALLVLSRLEYARERQGAGGSLRESDWEDYVSSLESARDERLLLLFYDGDGDGVIGARDIVDFIDWYRAGSDRADANGDQRVDTRDLSVMLDVLDSAG